MLYDHYQKGEFGRYYSVPVGMAIFFSTVAVLILGFLGFLGFTTNIFESAGNASSTMIYFFWFLGLMLILCVAYFWWNAIAGQKQWKRVRALLEKEKIFRMEGKVLVSQTRAHPLLVFCSEAEGLNGDVILISGKPGDGDTMRYDLASFEVGKGTRFNCMSFARQEYQSFGFEMPTYRKETFPSGIAQIKFGKVLLLKWT